MVNIIKIGNKNLKASVPNAKRSGDLSNAETKPQKSTTLKLIQREQEHSINGRKANTARRADEYSDEQNQV